MGMIAWILLGLAAGLFAWRLLPGRNAQGFVPTCAAGVCGALFGGWAAVSLFHAQALSVFFGIPAWLTALIGAAIFLMVLGTPAGGPAGPWRKSKAVPAVVPVRRRDASR